METPERTWLRETRAWAAGRTVKAAGERAVFALAARRILARRFRLVIVAGQKRSGNHAFINWFLSQSRGPCIFFNHVRPGQYPTERHRREFRLNDMRALPTVAFSYEDRDLSDILGGALTQFVDHHEARIESRTLCLILRDPKNLMASRFKKWPEELAEPPRADRIMAQWKDYAGIALARPPDLGFDLTPVYYNAFITDRAYRDRISDALRIRAGDRGLDTVSNYGYGSSFDGMAATGAPGQMDIFGRWKAFEDEPRFNRLFEDAEIGALQKKLEATAGL